MEINLIYAGLFSLPTLFLTVFLTLTCTESDKFRYKLDVITQQLLSLLEISRTLVGLLTFSFGFLLYLRISKVPSKAVQICTNLALKVFPDACSKTEQQSRVNHIETILTEKKLTVLDAIGTPLALGDFAKYRKLEPLIEQLIDGRFHSSSQLRLRGFQTHATIK